MEEIKLWKITTEKDAPPTAIQVDRIAQTTTELLLENVLTAAPDLLMPGLTLIGRQTQTPSGPLDLLGVDEDGRLVIFELKRGKLSRDAVAQAIDYASYIACLEAEELCSLIHRSPGIGIERKEDFSQWYQSSFNGRRLADIGAPRIVLVGLGVDDGAKRMVTFLARSELDISLITFQGFEQNGQTLLARHVEVQASEPGTGKLENQARLNKLVASLGIEQTYMALIAAIKQGLGGSAYQSPNPSGYSFYLPEVSAAGANRAYIALYAPETKKGQLQIFLQSRAIETAQEGNIKQAAAAMDSNFVPRAGWGEIWIDGHQPASKYTESLRGLAQAIASGWKLKMENQTKAEAAEAAGIAEEAKQQDAEALANAG